MLLERVFWLNSNFLILCWMRHERIAGWLRPGSKWRNQKLWHLIKKGGDCNNFKLIHLRLSVAGALDLQLQVVSSMPSYRLQFDHVLSKKLKQSQ